jgi:hypothetical protein
VRRAALLLRERASRATRFDDGIEHSRAPRAERSSHDRQSTRRASSSSSLAARAMGRRAGGQRPRTADSGGSADLVGTMVAIYRQRWPTPTLRGRHAGRHGRAGGFTTRRSAPRRRARSSPGAAVLRENAAARGHDGESSRRLANIMTRGSAAGEPSCSRGLDRDVGR